MSEPKTTGSARERLLKAADELFYAEGVHTVGIDRILAHSGVAKASLYSHFKSKDELVQAYLNRRAERLAGFIESHIAKATSPRARILAVFDEFIERSSSPTYYGCPFVRACAEEPAKSSQARQATTAQRVWLRDLFKRLATDYGAKDPAALSRQLALIYDGAAVAVSMDGDPEAGMAARQIVEKLLHK